MESLRRDLLARAFRCTLHRLRGVRGLLSGWLELGVPAGSEGRVRVRLDEDMLLLARLDWICSMMHHPQPLKRLEAGEAPAVLLAAALGLGTPEEARDRLPHALDPEAAIGLALWLQLIAPEGMVDHDLHLEWQNRSLVLAASGSGSPDLTTWREFFAPLVIECDARRIVMRPGAFLPLETGAETAHAQA